MCRIAMARSPAVVGEPGEVISELFLFHGDVGTERGQLALACGLSGFVVLETVLGTPQRGVIALQVTAKARVVGGQAVGHIRSHVAVEALAYLVQVRVERCGELGGDLLP